MMMDNLSLASGVSAAPSTGSESSRVSAVIDMRQTYYRVEFRVLGDAEHNGFLNQAEFTRLMKLMRLPDAKNTSKVLWKRQRIKNERGMREDDYVTLMMNRHVDEGTSVWRRLFAKFDEDGTGMATKEQLLKGLRELGIPVCDTLKAKINDMDANKDGFISYGEFLKMQLFHAGADPNFDECLVEDTLRDKEHNTAFGRQPYPSALHCVVDAALNYAEEVTDAQHVTKYAYKCAELLLRHGADASYVGKYHDVSCGDGEVRRRGSVLHALCDAAPRLGVTDNSLLLLLLRHGADPDQQVDLRYPLTSYFDALCRHGDVEPYEDRGGHTSSATTDASGDRQHPSSSFSSSSQPRTSNFARGHGLASDHHDVTAPSELVTDVRRMCRMLGFMSLSSQQVVADDLRARLTSLQAVAVNPSAGGDVISAGLRRALLEVEKYMLHAPSLRRSCAAVLWRSCRRHVGNVYKLPAPMPLINEVMDNL